MAGQSRENNFNMIRLMGALFVFVGHMGMIRSGEPLMVGSFQLHELGVFMLFLVSGYLITQSWLSDSSPLRYGIRRFLRLWPPFAAAVLIMVFAAGPLVSELGVGEYFQSWFGLYLRNLRFFTVYSLPGVFSGLLVHDTVNGSLWTMPVEALLYVLTPLMLTLLRVKGRTRNSLYAVGSFAAACCIFDCYLRICRAQETAVIYGTDWIAGFHLMTVYVIGILFTYKEVRRYLNLQAGVLVMSLLFMLQTSGALAYCLFIYLGVPYFIFSAAFAPSPLFSRFGRKWDLSYGIYLYGFFFEQLVMELSQRNGWSFSFPVCLLLSGIPTLAAALVSCALVERPCVRLSHFLTGKTRLKAKEGREQGI